jgi:hypothetical protein
MNCYVQQSEVVKKYRDKGIQIAKIGGAYTESSQALDISDCVQNWTTYVERRWKVYEPTSNEGFVLAGIQLRDKWWKRNLTPTPAKVKT